jgi:hypothetical protein
LRTQLNGVLKQWKKDGTLEHVLDHWITVKKTTIEVNKTTIEVKPRAK